jgi:hypothetical protein
LHIGTGIEGYGTSNSHWFNLKLAFRTGTGIALKKSETRINFDFLKNPELKRKPNSHSLNEKNQN